jgi:hypothetical protein
MHMVVSLGALGLVQKEWQDVNNLVDADSAEANAHEKTECQQVVGNNDNAGSSESAGASAATYKDACTNQEMFFLI